MNLYPAIDLRQGRVVRLEQGRADRETVYYDDPSIPAGLWKDAGAQWLHVVDLDGAFSGQPQNWAALEKIVSSGLKIQMGGGMRRRQDIERAFDSGVSRVVVGTSAVEDGAFLQSMVDQFGSRIAVGIDARNGKVALRGWVDETELSALDLARRVGSVGVETIIFTDISTDGMLTGPNFAAQTEMLEAIPMRLIASGGVASSDDLRQFQTMSESYPNLEGVIIGKALYDGKIDLGEWFGRD